MFLNSLLMLIAETSLQYISALNLSYKYTEIKKPPEGGFIGKKIFILF